MYTSVRNLFLPCSDGRDTEDDDSLSSGAWVGIGVGICVAVVVVAAALMVHVLDEKPAYLNWINRQLQNYAVTSKDGSNTLPTQVRRNTSK